MNVRRRKPRSKAWRHAVSGVTAGKWFTSSDGVKVNQVGAGRGIGGGC